MARLADRTGPTQAISAARLLLALTVLLPALFLVSCGKPSDRHGRTAPTPAVLRVGAFPNLTHAPALVGLGSGIFAGELAPTRLEWRFFNAGPQVVEAVFAGELDLAYVGPGPALNGYLRSKGHALRIVSGVARGGAALVVRGGIHWTDPADLVGRKIATPGHGNTQDQALRWWIRQHGRKSVDEGGQVAVMPVPNSELINLFRSGEIDGAWTVEPWVSRLVQEAGGRVLLDESAIWPDMEYATTVLIVRSAFAAEQPDLLGRWVAAQDRVMELITADPDSARRTVQRELARLNGKALPDSVLELAWGRIRFGSELPVASILEGGRRARALGFLAVDPPPAESLLVSPGRPGGEAPPP